MEKLLSTKEVAELLAVNEKMIYTMINEKGLPATKITGKWLFPKNLVEQWVESRTINYPKQTELAVEIPNLLLIAGSNDILLDSILALFRHQNPDYIAFFGNLGSLGGLRALKQGQCHMATSHLDHHTQADANFSIADIRSDEHPATINFCRREQGWLVPTGNPNQIANIADIADKGLSIANRPLDSSTRVILDSELKNAGLDCRNIKGYEREFQNHLDIGLEILAGRADTGLAIRAVATLLGLDFVSLRWERFDLLIPKNGFFAKSVQLFLEQLKSNNFRVLAENFSGYDLSLSGKMIYQQEP